jgi:serine protease Do
MKNLSSLPTSVEVNSILTEPAIKQCEYSQVFIKTRISQNIKQMVASMTVAKMACQTTVQIVTASGASASGVIIKKQDDCYTVLTAKHLFENADTKGIVYTHEGKIYPVSHVIQLSYDANLSNLAIVQFSTSEKYAIATLNQTDQEFIGTKIYISGYLQTVDFFQPEFKFLHGMIINCSPEKFLHNSTVIYPGMSGSPVFNAKGQVIGIYLARVVDQDQEVGVKTNVFIPLNSLANLNLSELGLNRSQMIKFPELPLS